MPNISESNTDIYIYTEPNDFPPEGNFSEQADVDFVRERMKNGDMDGVRLARRYVC